MAPHRDHTGVETPPSPAADLRRVHPESQPRASRLLRHFVPFLGLLTAAFLTFLPSTATAADPTPDEARELIRTGEYKKAIKLIRSALDDGARSEDWHALLAQTLVTVGQYTEARDAITNAVALNRRSLRLRWVGREACLAAGDTNQASEYLDQIRMLVSSQSAPLSDPRSMVALGRAALHLGADPKVVLDRVLAPVRQADPTLIDTYLARGEIALEKHDANLASRAFAEGLKQHPTDPDLHYGLALAHLDGDRSVLVESLENALRINERHIPSLLLLADHQIDAEDYAAATKNLDAIDEINPVHPDAWAFRAVLAHLRNDAAAETKARETALRHWPTNPRVDHLIGLKLSRKYRFAEGARHQRQALAFDPAFLPAKSALASDLLRLGDEDEGWRLADEVHSRDAYDVAAYNLVTLRDTMRKYATLTNEHFLIRLTSREAEIYGPRVLDLLERARGVLTTKYGIQPKSPTIVEIFAEQKDFGVRTFGMPDNPGFLGVCFGRVVTANGPAATRGMGANWEAVLWHEYTHVITLQLTANRMPRWLSEGISVYEEFQANPSWGQRFSPRYRSMIVGGEMTPVAQLSGAFLAPKSPFHLQFAYFQSYLVIDYIIRRHGIDSLRRVLNDLREGTEINAALAKHVAPIADLEKQFKEFAVDVAKGVGPSLEWEKPPENKPGDEPGPSVAEWSRSHPSNYYALRLTAQRAISEKDWKAAKAPLLTLVERFPNQGGADSAWPQLALVHRSLGETNEERAVLIQAASLDHESPDVYLRLMELAAAVRDWPQVLTNATRYLGVNPLVPAPYRYLAEASEATGNTASAVSAYQTLLKLDPPNPADTHFQLARLLKPSDPVVAKRHVLQSLEEAPRHRHALRLLLDLQSAVPAASPTPPSPKPKFSPQ